VTCRIDFVSMRARVGEHRYISSGRAVQL
jgi:hypothetical protein